MKLVIVVVAFVMILFVDYLARPSLSKAEVSCFLEGGYYENEVCADRD